MIPQTRIGISQAEHVKAVEPDIGLGLLPVEPPNDSEPRAVFQLVNVADSGEKHKYESVDKVPEQYRDKVKSLVEMGEKGAAKVEIK